MLPSALVTVREPLQLAPWIYRSLLVRYVLVRALQGCAWDLDPGSDPFEAGWKQFEADLRAARDACVAMRSRLVGSIVPVREQLRRTRRALASRHSYQGRIRSICGRLNIVCLDPFELFRERPEMDVYIENDPHFSPAGHELYGRFLAAELRRTAAAAQAP